MKMTMMPSLALAVLLCAAPVCAMPGMVPAGGEQAAPAGDMMARARASFEKMDTDKDGKVSRDDFRKTHPNMTNAAFDKIDASHDGQITADEWAAFFAGHGAGGKGMQKPSVPADAATPGAPAGQKPLITPPAK